MADPTERYSRQVLFAPIGTEGQRRLGDSRVTVVGCGALGALSASLLARAGVGRLRVVDRDLVEQTNLQRQVLFEQDDVDRLLPKAAAAADHLRRINPDIEVEGRIADVTWRNVDAQIGDADLIVDGTDNFETRYLLNDFAVSRGLPWIYGACVGSYGITFTIVPGLTPCLRCILPDAPAPGTVPTCDQAGILAPVAGMIASHQVGEALKILTGHRERIDVDLLTVDIWENRTVRTRATREEFPGPCRCCGERRFEFLEGAGGSWEHTLCGRDSIQITPPREAPMDLAALERKLGGAGDVERNRFLLRLNLPDHTLVVFPDGRALVSGTRDVAVARSLYARFVGS
jgi:adenylyltransferase/sulfurtransferase